MIIIIIFLFLVLIILGEQINDSRPEKIGNREMRRKNENKNRSKSERYYRKN